MGCGESKNLNGMQGESELEWDAEGDIMGETYS